MNKNIKYLIEDVINFNPADYSDDENEVVNSHTIDSIVVKATSLIGLKKIIKARVAEDPKNPYLLDIDVSNVKTMNSLFNDKAFRNIEVIDIHTWDISGIGSTASMFESLEKLKQIIFPNEFRTIALTDMKKMFRRCKSLTTLDLSQFDTYSVTDMSGMFEDCYSLIELNISNFDTAEVKDMSLMFKECHSLTKLDVTHFDTSNVEDMSGMFEACVGLISLDLSNFDTSSVVNMERMFLGSANLTYLDLSGWDTSNVENMSWMFATCRALTELDLSSFTSKRVETMQAMFANCINLEKLHAPKLKIGGGICITSIFYNTKLI